MTTHQKDFFFVSQLKLQRIWRALASMMLLSLSCLLKMENSIDKPDFGRQSPPSEILTPTTMPVTVVQYDPAWPNHFQQILQKLRRYLEHCGVQYIAIDHVGSTAVPGLAAKPNIDVVIEVPDAYNAEAAREALTHEPPPEEHYKCIGDGGIRGRISMKLHDRSRVPDQSM